MDGELAPVDGLASGEGVREGVRYADRGEVGRWLGTLPLLPPAEAARRIGGVLDEVSGEGMRPRALFGLLQRLEPLVRDLLEALEGDGQPGAPSAHDTERALRLRWQMALGYRAIIDHGRPWLGVWGGRRRLTAAFRAMRHAGAVTESYARLNRPVQAEAWSLLASVFLFGANAARGAARRAFHDEFKYRLMLGRLSPNEFKAPEWRRVRDLVRDLAPHCRLESPAGAPGPHRLVVDPEGEAAPFASPDARAGSIQWTLDLEPAVRRIAAAMDRSQGGRVAVGPHRLPRYACRRLCERWRAPGAETRPRRAGADRDVTLIGGLSAIAAHLQQGEGAGALPSAGEPAPAGDCLAADGPAYWVEAFRKPVPVCVLSAQVVDIGPSGAGLKAGAGDLRVGELVRVAEGDGAYLATVRWVRTGAEGSRLGVEQLGAGLRACRLAVGTASGRTQPLPALLFETKDGGAAVALPNLDAHLHERILLYPEWAGTVVVGRDRLFAISAIFEAFRLSRSETRRLVDAVPAPPTQVAMRSGRRGPDDVWARTGYR